MRLVYKFISTNKEVNKELLRLCKISKDLYNQTLYCVRKELETNNRWLNYNDLNTVLQQTTNLEGEINYRKLKAQVSQQTIKHVCNSVMAYIKSIKKWKVEPSKFNGMPKFPRFLPKKGHHQLDYTNQSCSIKNGRIYLTRSFYIEIPQYDEYKERLSNFQQVRIIPKDRGKRFEIEIVYLYDEVNSELDFHKFASIDLGLDNLVTLVSGETEPILYSGKQLKSVNQFMNKRLAKIKSILAKENSEGLEHPKGNSKLTRRIYDHRNDAIKDLMNKVSRHIVNYLLDKKIGTLVVGYNNDWKDSINLGDKTNQNFVSIPHRKLVDTLIYKCKLVGIILVEHEESYTSKCDALDKERICKHAEYSGKRVKRGLFQSSVGKLINADVNGALNIMRKVVGDSHYIDEIINRGLLFNPVKYSDLYNLSYCGS